MQISTKRNIHLKKKGRTKIWMHNKKELKDLMTEHRSLGSCACTEKTYKLFVLLLNPQKMQQDEILPNYLVTVKV